MAKLNSERLVILYTQHWKQWGAKAGELIHHMLLSLDLIREQRGEGIEAF